MQCDISKSPVLYYGTYKKNEGIPSNYKELTEMITEQHKEQAQQMQELRNELASRVGVLEKWRWLIIGGSIVVGFIIQKFLILS